MQHKGRDWSKEIELVDCSEYHKDRSAELAYRASKCKKFLRALLCPSLSKTLLTVLIIVGFVVAYKFRCLEIWASVSGIVLIFANLGKQKKGELSPWSVFNKNFEKPIGHDVAHGTSSHRQMPKSGVPEEKPDELVERATQYFKKSGKYGNQDCYCSSGLKYKKCCLPLDQKFGPHNQARVEPTK